MFIDPSHPAAGSAIANSTGYIANKYEHVHATRGRGVGHRTGGPN